MTFKTLDNLTDIAGKRVLVRVDLNVPVKDGKVTDATRIERVAPTIQELSKKGAKVVFRNSKTSFESTLGGGELRGGRCVFRFELSALDVDTDLNYRVTVGGVEGTPVSGAELANSSDPVVVYVG